MAQDFGILREYEILSRTQEGLPPSTEIIETGFDNRSLAMGKTTTITSRSSSALFSNPSVLATFSKLQGQVGGKLLYGTITDEIVDIGDGESYESGYPIVPNRSYFAVAMPYQFPNSELKLVFGVGYQRNEGTKWESEFSFLQEEWSDEKGEPVDVRITQDSKLQAARGFEHRHARDCP